MVEHESHEVRLGDEERRLMHLVPAPAVRHMKTVSWAVICILVGTGLVSCSTFVPTLPTPGINLCRRGYLFTLGTFLLEEPITFWLDTSSRAPSCRCCAKRIPPIVQHSSSTVDQIFSTTIMSQSHSFSQLGLYPHKHLVLEPSCYSFSFYGWLITL